MSETEERRESQTHGTLTVDNIPAELRERNQWAVWRKEKRDGKWKKVPYSPASGRRAKSNNPETWCSLREALDALAFGRGRYEGISFALSEDDPYACIDLDKCRDPESGALAGWAAGIVSRFGSYSEASPSGTGVHITVRGKLPPEGRKEDGVEMYDSKRLITFTSRKLPDTPDTIEERQQVLGEVHNEVFGERLAAAAARKNAESPEPRGDGLGDGQVVSKASTAANGDKFVRLLEGGWEGAYPSQSEADQALCSILAFWSGDAGQVDRIFRGSGLYREKWDKGHHASGETYGEATVSRALAGGETYSGGGSRNGSTKPRKPSSYSPDSGEDSPRRIEGRVLLRDRIERGVEPTEELEPEVLLRGRVHSIYGPASSGKSWLMLWLVARCVARGERVVVMDDENGSRIVAERLPGLGVDTARIDELLYYFPDPNLTMEAEVVEAYERLLDKLEPTLIVFDSLVGFLANAGYEENSNDGVANWAARYTRPARRRGIAVVVLDHVGHEGGRSRGASRKKDAVDVMWALKNPRPFDRETVGELQLCREKDREGVLPATVKFSVGGGEDGFIFRRSAGTVEEAVPVDPDELKPSERDTLEALRGFGTAGAANSEWQRAAGSWPGKVSRTRYYEARKVLLEKGFAVEHEGGFYAGEYLPESIHKKFVNSESHESHGTPTGRGGTSPTSPTPRRGGTVGRPSESGTPESRPEAAEKVLAGKGAAGDEGRQADSPGEEVYTI